MIQRVLTALVLLAGFLAAVLLLPRPLFAALGALVVGVAASEWSRLCGLSKRAGRVYGIAMACGSVALYWAAQATVWTDALWVGAIFAAATLFWLVIAPLWMAYGVRREQSRLLAVMGLMVMLPGTLALVLLPPAVALGALALVWIADSAAYFSGRALGRRKLAPRISPGKTWEGVAGGLLGVQVYAIICAFMIPALAARLEGSAAWLLYLGGGGLLCVVSIIGDLFESAVKRQASVKDSGSLLPGHGGVLDRIDSAVAVLPVVALIAYLFQAP